MICCQGAQNIALLVELFGQLAIGRIQLKKTSAPFGAALFHMDVTGRFLGIVPGGSNGCVGQFIMFVSTDMQLSGEDDGSGRAEVPMKVAITMRVPAIQHADMPRVIDIKNRTPITDGRIANTVLTVVSPVQLHCDRANYRSRTRLP